MRTSGVKKRSLGRGVSADASIVSLVDRDLVVRVRGKSDDRFAVDDAMRELALQVGERILVVIDYEMQAANVVAIGDAEVTLRLTIVSSVVPKPTMATLKTSVLAEMRKVA